MSIIGNETSETETPEASTEETTEQKTETNEHVEEKDPLVVTEAKVEFPEGLDEELAKDPSLQVFVKDGKINYANMMKSYVHAQRQMGADKVVIPGKNSTDEEREAFFNKLGRPELDKYEVKSNLPEGQELDAEMVKGFVGVAHKAGILPQQAQAVMDWFNEQASAQGQTLSDTNQAEYDKQLQGLKTEWGDGYEREVTLADRALKEFASPEEIKYLVDAGIADDVNVVRLFNKIGKGLSEDTFVQESHGSFGMTQEEAGVKINEHLSNKDGAYMNKDHPNHKNAVAEVAKLHEVMAG